MGMSVIPFSFSEEIPDWVKHTAQWWADRKISQSDFTNALESLIKDGVINIPPTELAPPGPDKIIPDWVRNTAGWWADDYIPDSDFINAIQYLVSIGLIEVKVATPEPIVEEIVEPKVINEKPIHVVLDGYDYAYQEENFVLDIEVFEEEKFFATHGRAEIPVENVKLDISLYNEENQRIHSFSGVVKDGKYRYDVVAKETSQERGLWRINNLYTVEVIATSGDNTAKKNYEFLGRESSAYDKGEAAVASYLGQIIKTVEINDFTTNGPALFRSSTEMKYGTSIANIGDLDGDGVNDLAVGMDKNTVACSSAQVNKGEVQIHFMNADGTLKSTEKICETTSGVALSNGHRFGSGVTGMGDINGDGVPDIAVGGYMHDTKNRGAVDIILMDSDGSVSSLNRLDNNDWSLDGGSQLGYAVENIGDLDGNGVNDLAVGGWMADLGSTPSNSGIVYIVFLNSSGGMESSVNIHASTTNGPSLTADDKYGMYIANIGDLDGDGVQEIAVSSKKDDGSSSEIHIHFMNTDGSIDSTVALNDDDVSELGTSTSVAIEGLGDIDGDGVGDMAVGLDGRDLTGTDRGSVLFLYMNSDGSVKSTAEFTDATANGPTLANGDVFGRSIANMGDLDGYSKFNIVGTSFKGDWDGNGVVELAVGAAGDDMASDGNDSSAHPNRGAVHLLFFK